MKKLLLLSLCFLLFSVTQIYAQSRTVTGTVTGRSDGLPLPGVSVIVKGTSLGTQTDANGKFSLNVPESARTLTFRFVGFTTQDVAVPASGKLNLAMDVDARQLGEVVVTGYNTVLKRDNVSSIAKVSGDQLANLPVTSFDQSLAGKAPGVQVSTSSGIIGAPVNIRIRGVSSITSGSQPLIVVDGVPIIQGDVGQLYNNSNALADLNPNDIESLDVLKDASATALYGSRGAAGVIVITTKTGKAGVSKVTLDTYFGFNEPANKVKVLNGDQYISVMNQKFANAGISSRQAYGDFNGDGTPDPVNTDWQDEVFHKGLVMNHQVGITSGTQKTQFYASASYQDYSNYIDVNRARRGSVRANVTHQANSWLKLGFNSQFSRNYQNGLGSGTGGAYSGIPYGPFNYYPDVPVMVNGQYYTGQGGNGVGVSSSLPNPVGVLKSGNYDNYDSKRFTGSGFAEATIVPGLRLKTTYGVDYMNAFEANFWNDNIGDGRGLGNLVQDVYNQNLTWDWTNTLSYNKTFGDHTINAFVGTEYNKFSNTNFYASAYGASDPFYTQFVGSAFTTRDSDGGLSSNAFDSYFGTVNYGFKGKYVAQFTYRDDAYSGFGITHRRGGFPSGSIGWNFGEEDFAKEWKAVSGGKLRASYGIAGNSQIGNYPSLATYSPTLYGGLGGSALSNAGNPDLRWEKTKQLDVGVDLTLFRKLNLTVDYYDKRTSDLILSNPVPYYLGIPGNSITQNVGAMYNRGLELGIGGTIVSTKDFSWTPNFNIAYNKNKVTATTTVGGDVTSSVGIVRPGYALGSYYLIQWAGVNSQTGLAQFKDAAGNVKQYNPNGNVWLDQNGNKTTAVTTTADRVVLDKSYIPKYTGGFNNTFKYKNIDLSVFLQYSFDFWVYDATQQGLHGMTANNNSVDILNSWTTPGQNAPNQKLYYQDNISGQTSTRWLEKGDFVRGKNIALGYTFAKPIISKLGLSSLRIYAAVQNAFTITGYKGTNPEAQYYTGNVNGGYSNTTGNIAGGYDYYTPYLARTWTLGLNVGF